MLYLSLVYFTPPTKDVNGIISGMLQTRQFSMSMETLTVGPAVDCRFRFVTIIYAIAVPECAGVICVMISMVYQIGC
jgi:hypothetical protein